MLKVIHGEDGKQNGNEIIVSIINALINPCVIAEFTWTGKTNVKGNKKYAFEKYKGIQRLVFAVCRYADHTYSKEKLEHDFVYTVFKYAVSRWKRIENSSSTDINIEPGQSKPIQSPKLPISTDSTKSYQSNAIYTNTYYDHNYYQSTESPYQSYFAREWQQNSHQPY